MGRMPAMAPGDGMGGMGNMKKRNRPGDLDARARESGSGSR